LLVIENAMLWWRYNQDLVMNQVSVLFD